MSFNFGTPAAGGGFAASSSSGATGQQPYVSPPAAAPLGGFATPTTTSRPIVKASDYNKRFPGQQIWEKLSPLLPNAHTLTASSVQGQEWMHVVQSASPQLLKATCTLDWPVQPNMTVRQDMKTSMEVQLTTGDSQQAQQAALTNHMLQDIFVLADDLRLSEPDAIALYAAAAQSTYNKNAHELYIKNRMWLWQTVVTILQCRVGAASASAVQDSAVIQVTHEWLRDGLIRKLIQFVRDATKLIQEWMNAAARQEMDPNSQQNKWTLRHLQQTCQERQLAVECIFMIAYQTQLKVQEVVDLVDLIKDLTGSTSVTNTTELTILDPLDQVPDAYYPAPQDAVAPSWMITTASTSPRLKSPSAWQRELVEQVWKMGQPQLLRCVCTCVLATMCALDTQAVLLDRTTNKPNVFGKGNALLPPESSSTDALAPIHSRLCKNAASEWKRTDILGLLMASYAMLLRSCPLSLLSPRQPSSPAAGIDVRKTWRECFEAPAEFKSFSFGRISLLPALQLPASTAVASCCNVAEFLLATLSEFTAHYLDVQSASGDRPISRAKWEQDAHEDLRLQKSHLEQQRQFQARYGTTNSDPVVLVPDFVDLLQRPDCMDDLVAFATVVCSCGPEYALLFWSREEEMVPGQEESIMKLVPSRALRDLRDQQSADDTLMPSYMSFLAALALAKNDDGSLDGSKTIHALLSEEQVGDLRETVKWSDILKMLQWYARELSPDASTSSTTSTESPIGSTAYYYSAGEATATATATATESTTRPKPRELGEENTHIVLSHLTLISNVASADSVARCAILAVNVPIRSNDGTEIVGQDSTLMVLFSLAVTALAPDVRGKVFDTIAELLCLDGAQNEQCDQIRQAATRGWELLEAYQILPIHLLEQFPSMAQSDSATISGLAFPPSSTALVGSKPDMSWIPTDPRYAIIYEMEHIESALGFYDSTGGFLSLLKSLFLVGGCPASLGSNWRLRPGCAPYIEYVINLVLPRATGKFMNLAALPFRTGQDKYTLTALALEVVSVVLSSYIVPMQPALKGKSLADGYEYSLTKAREQLGHAGLAQAVVMMGPSSEDSIAYHDLDAATRQNAPTTTGEMFMDASATLPPTIMLTTGLPRASAMPDIPPVKSPGLTVLAEVLSSIDSTPFNSLVAVLVDGDAGCVASDNFALAYSLYLTTPPSFANAKKKNRTLSSRQVTLEALRPVPVTPTFSKSQEWKERSALSVLRVLCAVVVREEALRSALSAAPARVSVVPILGFHKKSQMVSQLRVLELQAVRLSEQIESADTSTSVVTGIIDCVSLYGSTVVVYISTAAVALVFHLDRVLGPRKGFELLCRRHDKRNLRIARAFGEQLFACGERQALEPAVDLMQLILDRLLQDLRYPGLPDESLTQTILGLPTERLGGLWTPGIPMAEKPQDCFDALLRLSQQDALGTVFLKAEISSCCYEVYFRLCSLRQVDLIDFRRAAYASERLRSFDFWKSHLLMMVQRTQHASTETVQLVHSLSWIMKGVGEELRLLAGVTTGSSDPMLQGLFIRHPTQFQALLEVLIDPRYDVFTKLMSVVPLEKLRFDASAVAPPQESIRLSRCKIRGSPDVVDGYEIIDRSKIIAHLKGQHNAEQENKFLLWVDEWNLSVMRDCAASHLTQAIRIALGSVSVASRELASHVSKDAGPWMNMLYAILDAMTHSKEPQKVQSLDETFSTTATRNLALAIFTIADLVVYSASSSNRGEISKACYPIAGLIALSGDDRNEGPVASRSRERTATLASALALLLGTCSLDQANLGDFDTFCGAAIVLSQLSVNKSNASISNTPQMDAMVSRACLSHLLRVFDNSADGEAGESFHRSLLMEPVGHDSTILIVDGFINCVRALDADISSLLLAVAEHRRGGAILIDRGIMDALQDAAELYLREEARFLASSAATTSFQSTEIATPDFLTGHLLLMSTLLSPKQNDREKAKMLVNKVSGIMSLYSPLIQRLVARFPKDGNVLSLFVKCISQLHFCADRTHSLAVYPVASNGLVVSENVETRISMLAIDILENPLPRSLQRPLPSSLERNEPISTGNVVSMLSNTTTWWDALALGDGVPSTEDICTQATLGLVLARDGLCGACHSELLFQKVDVISLLRALCRCVDVLKWAANIPFQDRTAALYPSMSPESGRSQIVTNLRANIYDTLENLLILVLTRLRQLEGDPRDQKTLTETRRVVEVALNYVGLDSMGFGTLYSRSADENKLDYTRELAKTLRKEIQSAL